MAYFVIGDVHGKAGMLRELLEKWDGHTPIVFLGDYIDRGEDSSAVLGLVKKLVDEERATALMGNHEYMFLAWIDDPLNRYDHYQRNGGDTTINSLLGRPLDHPVDNLVDVETIKTQHADMIDFIRQLPFYLEDKGLIFVHAGIDLSTDDWHATSDYDMVWLRKPFHEGINHTGATIYFGHTPTFYLLGQKIGTKDLWLSQDSKVGLDGGAVYGGVLHGLTVDETGILRKETILHDGGIRADD